MQEDFGVTISLKRNVVLSLQFTPQFPKVVNLAVIDQYTLGLFVNKGLMATPRIDDRQPSVTKTYRPVYVGTATVWTSMKQRSGHLLQECDVGRRTRVTLNDAY